MIQVLGCLIPPFKAWFMLPQSGSTLFPSMCLLLSCPTHPTCSNYASQCKTPSCWLCASNTLAVAFSAVKDMVQLLALWCSFLINPVNAFHVCLTRNNPPIKDTSNTLSLKKQSSNEGCVKIHLRQQQQRMPHVTQYSQNLNSSLVLRFHVYQIW